MGVDPGVRGGVAVLRPDGDPAFIRGFSGDMTEGQLVLAVKTAVAALRGYNSTLCFYERVGSMPTDGRKGAFTFGRVDGLLAGAMLAHDIMPNYVMPAVWQARMGCLTRGNKNVSKDAAQRLFPHIKMTHAIADALLIAAYGQDFHGL